MIGPSQSALRNNNHPRNAFYCPKTLPYFLVVVVSVVVVVIGPGVIVCCWVVVVVRSVSE